MPRRRHGRPVFAAAALFQTSQGLSAAQKSAWQTGRTTVSTLQKQRAAEAAKQRQAKADADSVLGAFRRDVGDVGSTSATNINTINSINTNSVNTNSINTNNTATATATGVVGRGGSGEVVRAAARGATKTISKKREIHDFLSVFQDKAVRGETFDAAAAAASSA